MVYSVPVILHNFMRSAVCSFLVFSLGDTTQSAWRRQQLDILWRVLSSPSLSLTQMNPSPLMVVICVCLLQIAAGWRGCVWQKGGSRTVEPTGALGEKVTKMTKDSSVSVLTCASKHALAVPPADQLNLWQLLSRTTSPISLWWS